MTHYCTACSSEFDDDSLTPRNAECVHCVFCGARIPLRRRDASLEGSVVPFSKDYEREEAFALGVINPKGTGFPDTLRQFRVHASPKLDSLTPHAEGSEPPRAPLPATRKLASLSVSLTIGFAVGVAIAFAAVSLRPTAKTRHGRPHRPGPPRHASRAPARPPRPPPRPGPRRPRRARAPRPPPRWRRRASRPPQSKIVVGCSTVPASSNASIASAPPSACIARSWRGPRAIAKL